MLIDSFKIITTVHKLILRAHRKDDAAFMVELNSDPEVTEHTPDGPLPSHDVAIQIVHSIRQQFHDQKIGRFIVEEAGTLKPIGWCGLKWLEDSNEMDLGYRFLKEVWGKGLDCGRIVRLLVA